MLNVGIIGLGHIAEHQIEALRLSNVFRLIAGCDKDPSRLSILDSSVTGYSRPDELLGRSDIDVVVVATPNRHHVDHGVMVLDAGKWLVVEKPAADSQSEFNRLADKRAQTSGRCTVALHAAFGPEVIWFHQALAESSLGSYRFDSILAQFYDPYVDDGVLSPGAHSLGGSWMDSGINALSVIGKLVRIDTLSLVDSRIVSDIGLSCSETQATVVFEVSDSRIRGTAAVDTSWLTGRNKKVTSLGLSDHSGTLVLDHSAQQVRRHTSGRESVLFTVDNTRERLTNHYMGVFDDLAVQIKARTDNFDYCQRLHRILYEARAEYSPTY